MHRPPNTDEMYRKQEEGPSGAYHFPDSTYKVSCPACGCKIGIWPGWKSVACPFCEQKGIPTKKIKEVKYKTTW